MKITIDCESCDGSQPVTQADLIALEQRIMSEITDKTAPLMTAIESLKARVEARVPTQADLDAIDTATASVNAILPAPVVVVPPVEVPPTA